MRAFLRAPAACHFYAITADDRKTHKNALKMLIGAMCHTAQRENFYAECVSAYSRQGHFPLSILEKALGTRLPLSRISAILDSENAKYFLTLDLRSRYSRTPLYEHLGNITTSLLRSLFLMA